MTTCRKIKESVRLIWEEYFKEIPSRDYTKNIVLRKNRRITFFNIIDGKNGKKRDMLEQTDNGKRLGLNECAVGILKEEEIIMKINGRVEPGLEVTNMNRISQDVWGSMAR